MGAGSWKNTSRSSDTRSNAMPRISSKSSLNDGDCKLETEDWTLEAETERATHPLLLHPGPFYSHEPTVRGVAALPLRARQPVVSRTRHPSARPAWGAWPPGPGLHPAAVERRLEAGGWGLPFHEAESRRREAFPSGAGLCAAGGGRADLGPCGALSSVPSWRGCGGWQPWQLPLWSAPGITRGRVFGLDARDKEGVAESKSSDRGAAFGQGHESSHRASRS